MKGAHSFLEQKIENEIPAPKMNVTEKWGVSSEEFLKSM